MRPAFLACAILLTATMTTAGEPDPYAEAIVLLKQSQEDHSVLVPAVKALAKAIEAMEKNGDPRISEANSCLYWSRKRMTLADTQAVGTNETAKRIEVATKPVAATEAKDMLAKAEEFAAKSQDGLLVSIRFFEIADRFPESAEGRKAMGLSLSAMAKVGTEKLASYKSAATDGKAFIQSDPSGAQILLSTPEGKKDMGAKTPSMVFLPKGNNFLELSLKGYKIAKIRVAVDGAIAKPDKVALEQVTIPIDVIFEAGWKVYVDRKYSKSGETPCTIEASLGRHEITLVKPDFVDVVQVLDVTPNTAQVAPKQVPKSGPGSLLPQLRKNLVGKYNACCLQWKATMTLLDNGTFVKGGKVDGKWEIVDGNMVLKWNDWPTEILFEQPDGTYTDPRRTSQNGTEMKRSK